MNVKGMMKKITDFKINHNECTMPNGFELYNVHSKSPEIEKWSIFSMEIDYVDCNRKVLPTNRVKFNQTGGSY